MNFALPFLAYKVQSPDVDFSGMTPLGWIGLAVVVIIMIVMVKNKYKK